MNAVILDNWTFQSIGELFSQGYDKRSTQALVVKGRQHAYESALIGDLQLEAITDLITNILLRDEFLIDSAFLSAWENYAPIFRHVLEAGLVKPTTPPRQGSAIADGTAFIVKQLCVTSSLKRIQSVNERHFEKHKTSKYPYQSQLVWGTAGMLSRSSVFDAPYVGHPLRQRFLESTGVFIGKRDVVHQVVELVKEKRASIYAMSTPALDLRYAQVEIPSVAIAAILKANSRHELLAIAVDHRDKHKKLRAWFTEFEAALQTGDTTTVSKHQRELNLLSRDVERILGKSSAPSFSMGMSLSGPSASFPVGEWLRSLAGKFSIRHDLMKQVLRPGDKAVRSKLKTLFHS